MFYLGGQPEQPFLRDPLRCVNSTSAPRSRRLARSCDGWHPGEKPFPRSTPARRRETSPAPPAYPPAPCSFRGRCCCCPIAVRPCRVSWLPARRPAHRTACASAVPASWPSAFALLLIAATQSLDRRCRWSALLAG